MLRLLRLWQIVRHHTPSTHSSLVPWKAAGDCQKGPFQHAYCCLHMPYPHNNLKITSTFSSPAVVWHCTQKIPCSRRPEEGICCLLTLTINISFQIHILSFCFRHSPGNTSIVIISPKNDLSYIDSYIHLFLLFDPNLKQ